MKFYYNITNLNIIGEFFFTFKDKITVKIKIDNLVICIIILRNYINLF